MKTGTGRMNFWLRQSNSITIYFLGSRYLTHALFWLSYYLLFSLIWSRNEQGLYASFYLEFVLMPVRILSSYCMLYVLIPAFLARRYYQKFFFGYAFLIAVAGLLQLLISYFFYTKLLLGSAEIFTFSLSSWGRSAMLINTTVILLGAAKVFQMYTAASDRLAQLEHPNEQVLPHISVRSDRRTHRIPISDILYVEGMGNYVIYHLENNDKKVVYSSLKDAEQALPDCFIRLHRSYLVNRNKIESFDNEEVLVSGKPIPRGKTVLDHELTL